MTNRHMLIFVLLDWVSYSTCKDRVWERERESGRGEGDRKGERVSFKMFSHGEEFHHI